MHTYSVLYIVQLQCTYNKYILHKELQTLIKIGLSVVSGSNSLASIESGSLFKVSRVVSNLNFMITFNKITHNRLCVWQFITLS